MAQESLNRTACVRATEARLSYRPGLPWIQQWTHSLCCVRVRDQLTFRYMAQESSRFTVCVRATGASFSFWPRLTLFSSLDTLTVLSLSQKPFDIQIHGTGKLKLHGLCKGLRKQGSHSEPGYVFSIIGYTHCSVFGSETL
jgi:hypothetical protein